MSTEGTQNSMPPGSVVITPTQMYNEIQGMSKKVDHLASVIDPALTTLRQDMTTMASQNLTTNVETRRIQTDFETRLRGLSTRMWILTVVAAASGAGIARLMPILNAG